MKKLLFFTLSFLALFIITACNQTPVVDEENPVISVVESKAVRFEVGSEEPDWTTYITAEDNVDGTIEITDDMINDSYVRMDQVGSFIVLYTVEDSAGNKTLKSIDIMIVDETAPIITIDNTKVVEFEVGTEEPDWTTYITATDNAQGEITITEAMVDSSMVDMDTLGTFNVMFTVNDMYDNEVTETITISIIDTEQPVIEEVDGAQLTLVSGASEPDWTAYVTATDNEDGVITIIGDMVDTTNVDMNTVGTFDVIFTVEDQSGNSASLTLTITITQDDETAPIIILNSEANLTLDLNSSEPDWTTYVNATDNVDGNIVITAAMVDASQVDLATEGNYDVIFTVTDAAGNIQTKTITINVEVPDTNEPLITLNPSLPTQFVVGSDEPDWTTYVTAEDDSDGTITVTESMIDVTEVSMDQSGMFDVIYSISDSKGNTATFTLTITVYEDADYEVGTEVYNYPFDPEDSGTVALVNLLEGNGYYINDEGYAETVYMDGTDPVFGFADAWTFVSTGYDLGIEEFVIETSVTALGHQTAETSPVFSVRIDYDWMMDIHFSFNNDSWSGVAVHNLPGGAAYSNDDTKGGLAPNLVLDLNTEYIFKIVISDSLIETEDMLTIYINGLKVLETSIPEVNANAQHIFGASQGSRIKVNNFKANEISYPVDPYSTTFEVYNYPFDPEDSGTVALVNLLEGNGYYINDEGYAETVYMDGTDPVFGFADAWTFVSTGYDLGIEEFVIETSVTALGHQTAETSPVYSVRIDYDWMMDIHFSFNNDSWSGVAVHNLPGGAAYSNDDTKGGLAPNLVLDLNTAYVFKIAIMDSSVVGEDILMIYVDDVLVLETSVPEVNANAQHIIGASQGSRIKVDYFKANLIDVTSFNTSYQQYNYTFDPEDSGTVALVNLLEGNGYYINDEGYAETVYMDGTDPVFGFADAWTFVSTGYDLGIEEFVIETSVTALGHQTAESSPVFSVRIDYDWMMDIHFSFNNDSWSGVAVHNLPDGSAYSNDAEKGGLAPSLVLDLNAEYIFKIVIMDGSVVGEDILMIYVDDVLVLETSVPDINANAQHIFGASQGSRIKVDYFKANLVVAIVN